MKVMRSKYFFPVVALIVWIAMIVLFGSLSRFSLAGLGLLVYGVCITFYETADDATAVGRSRQRLAGEVGLVAACIGIVNAFYLESPKTGRTAKGTLFRSALSAYRIH